MSEPQVIRKVVVRKKVKKEKVGITYEELLKIRQWVLTGSFNNILCSDRNKIDLSKVYLIKNAAFSDPQQLNKIMLDYSKIAIKTDTLFIILILLSSGSFQAKKYFRESFNKIIKTPNDLYKLFSLIRRYRGIGSIIHVSVKKWFKSHDIHTLERMFVEERSKYSWSGQDIVRLIKIKPRDKKEGLLIKWLFRDGISFNEQLDYKEVLPVVYTYERLRHNVITEAPKSIIKKMDFNKNMIPSNVGRTKSLMGYLVNKMSNEELVYFLKNHNYDDEAHNEAQKRLDEIKKNNLALNIDTLELLSIVNTMIEDGDTASITFKIENIIENKIKKSMKTDETIHIVDMADGMFNKKNDYYNITPAVISSIVSSKSKSVFTFYGDKRKNNSIRSILEAEGKPEKAGNISIDAIGSKLSLPPKTLFVWTNRGFLKNVERDMEILSKIYSKSNLCLINLDKAKLKNNNPKYYIINGFNKNTKRLMKLVEKGMVI